jgi:Glyoxalase-like domain
MATRLTAVMIQACDPKSLSEFWTSVLGADAVAGAGGVALQFVSTQSPKAGKNRVHLELKSGPEQLERVLGLGAQRADIGQGSVAWEVLADPEGNEFCLQPGLEEGVAWTAICQDAADSARQARFWAAAAGLRVVRSGEWGVAMASSDVEAPAPLLVMGPPVAPKQGPNRLSLALAPRQGSDPAVEASRLVAEGALREDGVLLDPEGNEFRVLGGESGE